MEVWVEGRVERALVGVSVEADEDVTAEGLEDGIKISMTKINPKVIKQYFI